MFQFPPARTPGALIMHAAWAVEGLYHLIDRRGEGLQTRAAVWNGWSWTGTGRKATEPLSAVLSRKGTSLRGAHGVAAGYAMER